MGDVGMALQFDSQWNKQDFSGRYEGVLASLQSGASAADIITAYRAWEDLRRSVASWKAVTEIRTRQDTLDSEAHANSADLASASPSLETHDAAIKRKFIESPHRAVLEARLGKVAFARWKLDIESSDPRNEKYLEMQSHLGERYTRLLGSMQFSLDGKTQTYAELMQLRKHPNREVRRNATVAQWAPFELHADELDEIFDELVACRTSMAESLGEKSYTAVAYRRLGRLDYGVPEVSALRDEIRESVVPLVAESVREQARSLHIDSVMPWDESFYEEHSSLPLHVPVDAVLQGLRTCFSRVDQSIGAFFETLVHSGLTDLDDRPRKAPGAFCEFLPHASMPFVFANVTGAVSDVMTIAHETGHAFQNYRSRDYEPLEFVVPTNEVGEIHSMAMEFFIMPFCEVIFGDAADEFRRAHLRARLNALPYIAAVDHFQQMVYENSSADAGERRAMWLDMERRYLPWRQDGGITALARGAAWQAQRHVYRFPFYYVDYGIAMCCALSLYAHSRADYHAAVERYLLLCRLGGTLPFRDLLRTAQLRSPFERGALTEATHGLLC
jgi:M3 family oligoendopeptidase